jgi:raffinose/stachyose/melibiose transport system substrate-binding protein
MKKILIFISILLVAFSMTACAPKEEKIEITFKQNKPEIDGQLQAFAAAYEAETGVKVNVVSCGGSSCSLGDMLRSDYASGNLPEIFTIDGIEAYNEWAAVISDLSAEKWVNDTDVAFKVNGKVVGFPVNVEGWGMAYNADLLEQAEIDPATLNNYDAYVAAFEKLNSMKVELGIDSVVSMAAGPGMYWVTGHHNFNSLLANGLPYGDLSVTNALLAGNVNAARLDEYADWVNLLFTYADKTVLTTGNYDSQVGAFLNQKAVFLHQGNWVDGNLKDATFDMAFAPHGSSKTATDGIFVSAPAWYIVNKDAKNAEAAKDFLEFMVYNQIGQDYMVNKAGMIPAFKNVTIEPTGKLSKSVLTWAKAGKIYSWNQYNFSGEFRDNMLGPIYNQLASSAITVEQFKELMKQAFADNAK